MLRLIAGELTECNGRLPQMAPMLGVFNTLVDNAGTTIDQAEAAGVEAVVGTSIDFNSTQRASAGNFATPIALAYPFIMESP